MPVVKLGICTASAQAKGSTLSPALCSRRLAPDSSCASPNFPNSTCVLQLPPTESTFIVNLQAPGKYVSSPTSSRPGAQPPRISLLYSFLFSALVATAHLVFGSFFFLILLLVNAETVPVHGHFHCCITVVQFENSQHLYNL